MKLILTGATGAAGLDILRAALADPTVSQVTVLSRRALPSTIPSSPKLNLITHTDYLSYPPALLSQLQGHGACIWAQGKSSRGMNEKDYTVLTHDYPMAAIKAFDEGGVRGEDGMFRFVYVSGRSTDPTGKSRILFARVKGKTETDLTNYVSNSPSSSSLRTHMLKPGYFFPSNPTDAKEIRSGVERVLDYLLAPGMRALFPSAVIKTQDMGRFAVEIAKGKMGDEVAFSNERMNELLSSWN